MVREGIWNRQYLRTNRQPPRQVLSKDKHINYHRLGRCSGKKHLQCKYESPEFYLGVVVYP